MKINLIEYFIETVNKFPKKTAVIDGDRQVTLAELDQKSRRLAKVIIEEDNGNIYVESDNGETSFTIKYFKL